MSFMLCDLKTIVSDAITCIILCMTALLFYQKHNEVRAQSFVKIVYIFNIFILE